MKESKRKTGKPKRAYSVPGILRKSLSIGLTGLFPCVSVKILQCLSVRMKEFPILKTI